MADNYSHISTKLISARMALERPVPDFTNGITALKTALVELTALRDYTLSSQLQSLIIEIESKRVFTPMSSAHLGQIIATVFTKIQTDNSLGRAMDTFQKSAPNEGKHPTPPKGNRRPPSKQ